LTPAILVSSQGGNRYCLYDENGIDRFRTRQDLIIRCGTEPVLIIDTKWKRITRRIDDPNQGVIQADIYQLMAYGRLYICLGHASWRSAFRPLRQPTRFNRNKGSG